MHKLIDDLKDCQHGSTERAKVLAKIVKHLAKHPMAACVPIRLTQTPTTYRVDPSAGI